MITSLRTKLSILVISVIISGCAGAKRLGANEKLYTGATITYSSKNIEDRKKLHNELLSLLQPKPNTKLLGSRPFLWLYMTTKPPKKEKGIRNLMKYKLGEPPVLLSAADPERTSRLLSNKLYNKGYFQNKVTYRIQESKKTGRVIYDVAAGNVYRIRTIMYPDRQLTTLSNGIREGSTLKSGQRYDLEAILEESKRIERLLKDSGYYYFDDAQVRFKVDSMIGNRQVDISVGLNPDVPPKVIKPFRLNKVVASVSPGFEQSLPVQDTLEINNMLYVDPNNVFKPKVISDVIDLQPGQLYSRSLRRIATGKLVDLDVFNFVNISYLKTKKDGFLNASIDLIPRKRKSLRLELQAASKSNNFVGSFLNGTLENRNVFRGAERLDFKLSTGFETQVNSSVQGPVNSFEIGLESSLHFPRLFGPVEFLRSNSRYIPRTRVEAGIRTMRRVQFFSLNSISLGLVYQWKNVLWKRHELYPVNVKIVSLKNTTPEFDRLLDANRLLQQSYEEQFIIGSRYSFTLNTLSDESVRGPTHNFYLNFDLDQSGNIAYLLQSSLSAAPAGEKQELLGGKYSQYVKAGFDFRHYFRINRNQQIVSRIVTGAGMALGNSNTLPAIKQFSIGGTNSIRAFPARSLGPGAYIVPDSLRSTRVFIDQIADIKIEGNLEYRHRWIGNLHGAVFVDAGNIWTLKEDQDRPNSQFKMNTFLDELAIGTGYGIRFDSDFFILRLDLAFPIKIPSRPSSDRWVVDEIAINTKKWRRENLVWNIALGYPF